ncbi:ATP-dependent Clp protease ATP-binding subunit [Patescibacteria group bacterium]|nr:ATP-dependent Clp protease ATP-binding subunit [Patescibacteria group bacterium]
MPLENSEQNKKEEALKLIPCDRCNGYSRLISSKKEVMCSKCEGLGMYAFYFGDALYWGKKMNTLSILEEKVERGVRITINGLLILLAVSGLVLGFLTILQNADNISSFESLLNLKEPGLLLFWISMLGNLYIVYRMDQEASQRHSVKKHSRSQIVPPAVQLTYDQVSALPKKRKIDISNSFTEEAMKGVEEAWKLASKLKHTEVHPIHLLTAMLSLKQSATIFGRLGINMKTLSEKILRALRSEQNTIGTETGFSPDFYQLLFSAYEEASVLRRNKVDVTELLIVITRTHKQAEEILYDLEVDYNKLQNVAEWLYINKILREKWKQFRSKAQLKPKGIMNRAMTARPTPILDSFSRDLTLAARAGALFPLIDRKKEVEEVIRVLEQRVGNVLLVGDSGVGKTIIGEGIAERMTAEDVPKVLQDKRLVGLDTGAMVAGAKAQGEIENRMLTAIKEASQAGNVVLFIDDIANLVGAGSTGGAQDAAGILANALSQGVIQVIGVATTTDFNMYLKNNDSFMRRFQVVNVEEMDDNAAIQVLEARSGGIEYRQKVFFSYDSIESAVKLSRQYIHDRYLPSKALDIIEEAAVYTRNNKGENAVVTRDEVATVLSEKTNVKVTRVTAEEETLLMNLENKIHERVIGQDEAVDMVAEALRRARAELRDENRPIANFLFVGPTGVGKTELAKTVADVYFGSEAKIIRLDMSEYQDMTSLARLIGAPPGYKGASSGGYLTEAVRSAPFSLLLLDELEKAHPNILDVFLQVMDDGRLTDGAGRTIDFTNLILIATSNAGTAEIQEGMRMGLTIDQISKQLNDEILKRSFKPEFLNRFDGVIVFKPLDFEQVVKIAKLELQKVATQLTKKGITLRADDEAIVELAQEGFNPEMGARPLRRVLQERVDSSLAKSMLSGKIGRRDIVVLEKGGTIRIEKAPEL